MTLLLAIAVALAGGVGASVRYLADTSLAERLPRTVPIVLVNVTGSALLGMATAALSGNVLLAVGLGLCGGYTTFSTAALDAVQLADRGQKVLAGAHIVGTAVACIAACAAGFWLLQG